MADYLTVIVAKGEGAMVAHERLLTAIAAKTLSSHLKNLHLNQCASSPSLRLPSSSELSLHWLNNFRSLWPSWST